MLNIKSLVVALVALAPAGAAFAQGTKENPTRPVATSNGAPASSSQDTMGGAFKGTGTPTFGTSPGMGSSDQSNRRTK